MALAAAPAGAERLRVALYNVDLSRAGPGLLLRDLDKGEDPRLQALARVIADLQADVLVITGFDYDARGQALSAFAGHLARAGASYPYLMALRPNTGLPTGLDVDGNGRQGEARDAQGFGRFPGEGAMAVLSRRPLLSDQARDFSALLWQDLPGADLPPGMAPELRRIQRLSTTGHWEVPVQVAPDRVLRLLVWYATPPVFDGAEDMNGRRNHDETAFWLRLLAGDLAAQGWPAPEGDFLLLGQPNLDPVDGEGRREVIAALLDHPALQDPEPRGAAGRMDPGQSGDPALDTALYPPPLGGLRVEVILPSAGLTVTGAGVVWPEGGEALALIDAAARHRPIWVDLDLP